MHIVNCIVYECANDVFLYSYFIVFRFFFCYLIWVHRYPRWQERWYGNNTKCCNDNDPEIHSSLVEFLIRYFIICLPLSFSKLFSSHGSHSKPFFHDDVWVHIEYFAFCCGITLVFRIVLCLISNAHYNPCIKMLLPLPFHVKIVALKII